MKAVGYVRISKKDQSVYSLDAQEATIREYCIRNSLEILTVYRDDGECSETFDRPDYLALETFLKNHKGVVRYLVITDHDRFSRNISEALAKISQLEKRFGVKVLAVGESVTLDPTDPDVFLGRALKYLLANHELLNIRKRTSRGIRNAMEAGRVVNNAPYGYCNGRDEKDKPILKVDEEKAAVVKAIFEQFIGGVSFKLIIRYASKNGYHRTGHSALIRLLSNCLYAGLIRLPAYDDKPERMIKALHQPIIPESVYWVAQEILKGRKGHRSHPKSDFPLRGIVKCDCGAHLTAAYSKGKTKYYMYYQCVKERGRNHRGEKLHELVEEALNKLSFSEEQLKKIAKYAKEELTKAMEYKTVHLKAKQQEFEAVAGKIVKLEEKMINDQIEASTYKVWFAKLNSQKGALEREIMDLKKDNKNIFERLDEAIPVLSNLKNLYCLLTLEGKQMLLNKVFEVGLIYDGEVLRTPMIHPALIRNYLSIKEKRPILVDQPDDFLLNLEGCTAYGNRTRLSSVKGRCPSR